MPVIAFLPWIKCQEQTTVGCLRLIPYERRKKPGDQQHVTQRDIDEILAAYSDYPRHRVRRATLVEVGEWRLGMDVDDAIVRQLFLAKEALTMSALSARRVLLRAGGYGNTDTYNFVVQGFKPNDAGSFSFSTRRRDGTTTHFWSRDSYTFNRPDHVSGDANPRIDERLLAALLTLTTDDQHVRDAISEFNQANTDATGVPEHVELVMMKSAFESLLGIGSTNVELKDALYALLRGIVGTTTGTKGPLTQKWKTRWPEASCLLEAWIWDFSRARGSSAHGKNRGKGAPVWNTTKHLLFCAILFPLVLKRYLAAARDWAIDDIDIERLKGIDSLISIDPFDGIDWYKVHPWIELENRAMWSAQSRRLYESISSSLEKSRPK